MARILCVEDEADLRADIVEELRDAGHETLEAGNGKEGLDAIARYRPDLVLCDIQMPVMDGIKLLRTVRGSWLEYSATPFVMLTAYGDDRLVKHSLKQGASDYLVKPVDYTALMDRLEKVLKSKKHATYDKIISRRTAAKDRVKTRVTGGDDPAETSSA